MRAMFRQSAARSSTCTSMYVMPSPSYGRQGKPLLLLKQARSRAAARRLQRPYYRTDAYYSTSSIITVPVEEANIIGNNNNNDGDISNTAATTTTISHQQIIKQQQQTELANIIRPYHEKQQPVVVRGAVRKTPATTLWSSWEYWQEIAEKEQEQQQQQGGGSHPMVAIEIGGSYGTADSERVEIPFSAYIQFLQLFEERHGRKGSMQEDIGGGTSSTPIIPNGELVYMAQNDLFSSLYKDIMIPDFCQDGIDVLDSLSSSSSSSTAFSTAGDDTNTTNATTTIGLGRLYSVMMWLGPRGCVSPLHFDPLDNCFMQHQGRKRVLLFAPSDNDDDDGNGNGSPLCCWHYAGHEGQQSNTSPINPEIVDWATPGRKSEDSNNNKDIISAVATHSEKYPLFFQEAPTRMECILEPGDMLYIPAKWWHHVRSIDTSASVNVWWR